jgi:hypothetical protein
MHACGSCLLPALLLWHHQVEALGAAVLHLEPGNARAGPVQLSLWRQVNKQA